MTTIASAVNTEFTPAAADFIVQVTGTAALDRKNSSGAAFCQVGVIKDASLIVSNPVAGAVFRFRADAGGAVVQADQ